MIKKLTYQGIFQDNTIKELIDKINELVVAVNIQHQTIKSSERRAKK